MYRYPLSWIDTVIFWYKSLGSKWQIAAAWVILPVAVVALLSTVVLALVCIPKGCVDSITK